MSLRELAISKSELGSETDFSMDFESDDCFLQILGKKIDELPEDHFIRPMLPNEVSSIGEIHFLPNGRATDDSTKRTEALYVGINAMEEYLRKIETNPLINYDFIYGRSDPHMASIARRIGFTTVDSSSFGSVIMYTTPTEIRRSLGKLKEEGIVDKIKNRYKKFYSNGGHHG